MSGHFLLQGLLLTQGSNPHLFCLLHWLAGSLPLVPPAKPLELLLTLKWYRGNRSHHISTNSLVWSLQKPNGLWWILVDRYKLGQMVASVAAAVPDVVATGIHQQHLTYGCTMIWKMQSQSPWRGKSKAVCFHMVRRVVHIHFLFPEIC